MIRCSASLVALVMCGCVLFGGRRAVDGPPAATSATSQDGLVNAAVTANTQATGVSYQSEFSIGVAMTAICFAAISALKEILDDWFDFRKDMERIKKGLP